MEYDLKKIVLSKLKSDSSVKEALSCKNAKRRIGMMMSVMKGVMTQLPVGRFNGELWCFGGKCYRKMSDSELPSLVYDCLEEIGLPYEDRLMSDKITRVCKNEVLKRELVPQNNIVVFENCVFDVDKRMEYPFNPKYIQMSMVHYNHDYNESPYEWYNFLHYVLPDASKRKVLQEFLGSIFIDRKKAKLEKIMILLGSGANGKSVVFDTVIGVLGRENVTNFGLGVLVGGNERKHSVASINGKRLNYCSEIRAIEIGNDSDALKTLISGEPTEARVLNGQYFMARNIPLLMANANKMPKFTDMSHGMRRRLCVIRFDVTVPKEEQDPLLSEKLKAEYPGIFNWIVEGRERFIRNGYKLSSVQSVEDAFAEEAIASNTVLRFLRGKRWYGGETESGELFVWRKCAYMYREYVKFCLAEKIMPDSANQFGRELKKEGFKKRRTGKGFEYAIFGKSAKEAVMTDGSAVMKVINQKKTNVASAWRTPEGHTLILGNRRLAQALGVGLKTVDMAIKNGWLTGCYEWKANGWHEYDLEKCMEVMRAHDVYKPGFKIAQMRTERAQKALDRNMFNKRMEALDLPYRKMMHKNRVKEGQVWVPDDYTVDDVFKNEGGTLGDFVSETSKQ